MLSRILRLAAAGCLVLCLMGCTDTAKDAADIGIIGGADGPTVIYVAGNTP